MTDNLTKLILWRVSRPWHSFKLLSKIKTQQKLKCENCHFTGEMHWNSFDLGPSRSSHSFPFFQQLSLEGITRDTCHERKRRNPNPVMFPGEFLLLTLLLFRLDWVVFCRLWSEWNGCVSALHFGFYPMATGGKPTLSSVFMQVLSIIQKIWDETSYLRLTPNLI